MDEDATALPEPSGDAPALDRDTAAAASGPASVRTQARAPLLLQPAVGHASAPEEFDDSWADNLPEVRPLSLNAKRLKLGKGSGTDAGVSQSLSPPSAPPSSAAEQALPLAGRDFPDCVVAFTSWLAIDEEPFATSKFIKHTRQRCTLWQFTDAPTRFCMHHAATDCWWLGYDPEGEEWEPLAVIVPEMELSLSSRS